MPVSSARLLSAGLAGGQADKPNFKSSDSLLPDGKHMASSTVSKTTSSHAQLSSTAGRLQHAAAGTGSLASSTGGSKYGTWNGQASSALQRSSLSLGSTTSLKAATLSQKLSSIGLLRAKVTSPSFDSIGASSSNSVSAPQAGKSSVSVQRSALAVFDAAGGPGDAAEMITSSHASRPRSAGPAGSMPRSSSTGRSGRLASSTASPTATARASSCTLAGLSVPHSSHTKMGVATVPGRARVMADRVLHPSGGDGGSWSKGPPGGTRGARNSSSSSSNSSSAGQQAEHESGPSHSRPMYSSTSAAAAPTAASSSNSSYLRTFGSLGSAGLNGQQQPPLFDVLPAGQPRTADTAAKDGQPGSSSVAGWGARPSSSMHQLNSQQPAPSKSNYLSRLHTQRAATADAVSTGASTDSSSAAAAAARRVSSANAAGSGGRQQALEALRAGRMRARAPAIGDAVAPSGHTCGVGMGSFSSVGTLQHTAATGAGRLAHCSSSRHGEAIQPQVQSQADQDVDSAVASLTALLDRINSKKHERAAESSLTQLPQQAASCAPEHAQDSQHRQSHANAELSDQQQQPEGNGASRRITDGEYSTPGERLEFPAVQPMRGPPTRSKSGSYLDIIRSSSATSRQPQQQQQQQQILQDRQPQPPLRQQPAQLPLREQYHPELYQQQVYKLEQYQPLQQRQRLQQQQQLSSQQIPQASVALPRQSIFTPSSSAAPPEHIYWPPEPCTGAISSSSGGAVPASGSGSSTSQVYRPPYTPPSAAAAAGKVRDQSSSGVAPVAVASSGFGASGVLRQHSSSSSGAAGPSDAVDSGWTQSRGSGTSQFHPLHTQQPLQHHQQQQAVFPEGLLHKASSSSGICSPQQGFLISTQPMAEHSYDAGTATAAAAAAGDDDAHTAGVGSDQAAAARRAFLNCSTVSSSDCSEDERPAPAAAYSGAAYSSAGATSNSRQHAATGSLQAHGGLSAAGSLGPASSLVDRALGRAGSRSSTAAQALVAANADANTTSESDSDVSEMSCSSSDSGSGSVEVLVDVRSSRAHHTSPSTAAAATAAPQYPQEGRSITAVQALDNDGMTISTPSYASRRSALAATAAGLTVSPTAATAGSPVPLKAYTRSLSNRVGGLPRGCCGIRNAGNTCYQNSALQLLGCVPELVGALLGQQAVQLFQGAAADAANNRSRRSVQQALTAAAAAAQVGIAWRPDAAVGPALQALVCEVWGFEQAHQRHQRSSPSQMVQRSVQHQQQLHRVTQCMHALRSVMAEVDPRWDDGDQWDCQEFCLALLQTVHNDSNRVRGKPRYCELKLQGCQAQQAAEAAAYARSWEDSVVLDIFSWQLQSTMTCCSCGRASHAFDSAQELLVAIPPDSEDVTVQDCLTRTTFSPEKMVGEEGYKCESCKALREATKQLQLFTYPQVMLLGLKRFETRGGSKGGNRVCEKYSSRKVSTRVRLDAGQLLDLSPFCNSEGLKAAAAAGRPPPCYELVAVADHTGYIHGGHYTARGRSVLDGSWVEFNDSLVLATDAPSGSTRDAYMMLYRLVG